MLNSTVHVKQVVFPKRVIADTGTSAAVKRHEMSEYKRKKLAMKLPFR